MTPQQLAEDMVNYKHHIFLQLFESLHYQSERDKLICQFNGTTMSIEEVDTNVLTRREANVTDMKGIQKQSDGNASPLTNVEGTTNMLDIAVTQWEEDVPTGLTCHSPERDDSFGQGPSQELSFLEMEIKKHNRLMSLHYHRIPKRGKDNQLIISPTLGRIPEAPIPKVPEYDPRQYVNKPWNIANPDDILYYEYDPTFYRYTPEQWTNIRENIYRLN
jgi:hypothetical protein